jgi:hypothetical protein
MMISLSRTKIRCILLNRRKMRLVAVSSRERRRKEMATYNCDVCGMNLKKAGKTEKRLTLSYKVLIVVKTERWKCPNGCELKGINNRYLEDRINA